MDYVDTNVSGNDGPIKVSFPTDTNNPLPKAWIETLHSLNHKATGDPFSGKIIGAFTNADSIDSGTRQRSYAASAYWKPVKDRKNLTVITGAHVQKIILEGSAPDVVAVGAQYAVKGETMTVNAREEVILSAGALHSTKLLELSGVGDPDFLSSLGISVVIVNKYVGKNFQDHPMSWLSFEVNDGVETIADVLRQDLASIERAMKQYSDSQSGPLALGGIFSYAFLPLQTTILDLVFELLNPSDTHSLKPAQTAYYNRLLRNPQESTASFFTYAAQNNFGTGSCSSLMKSNFLPGNYHLLCCDLPPAAPIALLRSYS